MEDCVSVIAFVGLGLNRSPDNRSTIKEGAVERNYLTRALKAVVQVTQRNIIRGVLELRLGGVGRCGISSQIAKNRILKRIFPPHSFQDVLPQQRDIAAHSSPGVQEPHKEGPYLASTPQIHQL